MKSVFKLVTLASLLVFVAACGKNKSGGSSSGLESISRNLSPSSAQALVNYENWYRSNIEGQGMPGFNVLYRNTHDIPENECDIRDIEIFGVDIGDFRNCLNFNLPAAGTRSQCRVVISGISASSQKPFNPTLANIASGALGVIVNATQSGSQFYISIQKPNGAIVSYIIDTSIHSAFQPVQKTDFETGQSTRLEHFMYSTGTSLPACPAL